MSRWLWAVLKKKKPKEQSEETLKIKKFYSGTRKKPFLGNLQISLRKAIDVLGFLRLKTSATNQKNSQKSRKEWKIFRIWQSLKFRNPRAKRVFLTI